MNAPNDNDEALQKKLKTWRLSSPLPHRFQEEVWRRIVRSQTKPSQPWWQSIVDWFEAALPQPAMAAKSESVAGRKRKNATPGGAALVIVPRTSAYCSAPLTIT